MARKTSPWAIVGLTIVLLLGLTAVWVGLNWELVRKKIPFDFTGFPWQTVTTTSSSSVTKGFAFAGLPRSVAYPYPILILTNMGYISGYDSVRKNPAWVTYHEFRVVNPPHLPRPSKFLPDPRTGGVVRPEDYTNSGYDRGHMAPNYGIAICYGASAQNETFLMSNIIPQKPGLNRQLWRLLEETEVRKYAVEFESIWVVTGPAYDASGMRLKNGTFVPAACFKIMLDEVNGQPRMLAFLVPQTVTGHEPASQFLTSVAYIQQVTGLDFFWELEDTLENTLEKAPPTGMW
jgi:endonuclease G